MENSTELIEHREQLVRALRIALGYVKTHAEGDATQGVTAQRHVAEIEKALAGPVYAANSVLKRLGNKITELKETIKKLQDEIENAAEDAAGASI